MAAFERVTKDGVRRGHPVTIIVDGTATPAFSGESVATTLLADDRLTLRQTPKGGAPRGVFCAMGVCFDCLVTIDGISQIRACMTPVRDGMRVDTIDRVSGGPEPKPSRAEGDRRDRGDLRGRKDPDGSL
jgi:aerobic-type carbon monoxide dehydrogenase small subunit (CoxS/CutS family)